MTHICMGACTRLVINGLYFACFDFEAGRQNYEMVQKAWILLILRGGPPSRLLSNEELWPANSANQNCRFGDP